MKCKDCEYFYKYDYGCIFSTDPEKEACELRKEVDAKKDTTD